MDKIAVEKTTDTLPGVPATMQPELFKVLITETRTDEAGNGYEFTRVEQVSADSLNTQKSALQKQIDEINTKLLAVNAAR